MEVSPTKRKARCMPISYKEPEDEDDYLPHRRKDWHRKTGGVEKRSTSPIKTDLNTSTCQNAGAVDAVKKIKLDCPVEKPNHQKPSRVNEKIAKCVKSESSDSFILPDSTSVDGSFSSTETPIKNTKTVKKNLHKPSPPTPKKNKVNLSWTAALKAQIQAAAKSSSKNSTKKKSKNTSNSPKCKAKPSHGPVVLNSPVSGSEISQGQEPLSYPSYLVAEDSMFSLDDSSQMDIIGDYYGAQYPPSEEISDFVPEDDDNGPAKIIGFDSF